MPEAAREEFRSAEIRIHFPDEKESEKESERRILGIRGAGKRRGGKRGSLWDPDRVIE
jgi:hypothetical protein